MPVFQADIPIVFDVAARSLTIGSAAPSYAARFLAIIGRHDTVVDLTGAEFLFTVSADGALLTTVKEPVEGRRLVSTSQDLLRRERVEWLPDQVIEVDVTITIRGVEHTASRSFTAPRPPSPAGPATWDDTAKIWVSPEP